MGPWHHGQEIDDGSTLGALKFDSDTALYFRREILRPFLAQYLKDDAPKADVAPVTAFETGTNAWRRLPAWPAGCASGCAFKPTPLYLGAGLQARLRRADGRRRGVRRVRLRSRQAGALPRRGRSSRSATTTA